MSYVDDADTGICARCGCQLAGEDRAGARTNYMHYMNFYWCAACCGRFWDESSIGRGDRQVKEMIRNAHPH